MCEDSQLEELLDRWEEAREQGETVDLNGLCRDCPELLEPLKSRIAAIETIDKCLSAHQEPASAFVPGRMRGPESVRVEAELVELNFHDQGGLGIVYRAHDHKLHRDVALKVLRQKIARNEEEQYRFYQEAEITGRLDHPGVVPVYAPGRTTAGQPFYVMRFIRGDTFDDLIKEYHTSKAEMSESERRIGLRKLLTQLISVCRTIGYAHTRGIVHRDIKPQNIMCGKYGETLVVDWGLAIPFVREGHFRVADEKTLVPRTSSEQDIVRKGEGTPVYMSPEQASGSSEIGPASDIYCLGGVLFKAITGQLAFDGDSPVQIKTSIMRGDFARPRQLDRNLPPALEAICLKSMALLPSERYATATAMADDIEKFLADAPVDSYRYSLSERLTRMVRRNQILFASIVLFSVLLAAASMSVATMFFQVQRQTNRSLAAAHQSQSQSLNMTCRSTARTIQYELEARLMALQHLAGDLSGLSFDDVVTDLNEGQRLKQAMEDHRNAVQHRLPSVSWFLLSPSGDLICIAADNENAHASPDFAQWTRPYFHGGEYDLDSRDRNRPPASTKPTLSPVFYSRSDDLPLCGLSVPVDGDNEPQGVLVMTIKMGQFNPLMEKNPRQIEQTSRFASLVETRGPLKGTFLHHPGLKKMNETVGRTCRVSTNVLERFTAIGCEATDPRSIEGYTDPFAGVFSGKWNTVALPVQIRALNGELVECGWFLMVHDRPFDIESVH